MAPVCQKACLGLKNNAFSHFILSASWLKIATPSSEWLWLVAVCAVFFLVLCFFFFFPSPSILQLSSSALLLFSSFLSHRLYGWFSWSLGCSVSPLPDDGHWLHGNFLRFMSMCHWCHFLSIILLLLYIFLLHVPAMINVSVSMLIFVLANTVPCRNVYRCV